MYSPCSMMTRVVGDPERPVRVRFLGAQRSREKAGNERKVEAMVAKAVTLSAAGPLN